MTSPSAGQRGRVCRRTLQSSSIGKPAYSSRCRARLGDSSSRASARSVVGVKDWIWAAPAEKEAYLAARARILGSSRTCRDLASITRQSSAARGAARMNESVIVA